MYSRFVNQDIDILDEEGYQKFVESKAYPRLNEVCEVDRVEFSKWDDYKIYGYFYPDMMNFLEELAKYVSGWVEFQYEEGFNFRLILDEGKVLLQVQPEINWRKIPKEKIVKTRGVN